jgi:cobalt-zinc-cadmium efflux system outer membrane protein
MGLWAAAVARPLCAEAPTPSATAVPSTLTLAEARRLALARNWDLLAAQASVDLSTAQQILAKQFPNPVTAFSVNKISVDSAHGSSTSAGNDLFSRSYDSIAAVGQLFEVGGKRSARKSSALAGREGAEARLADAKRQLDLGVTRAYVATLTAADGARILRESSALLRKEAGIAEARRQAGDISSIDRSQIEIAAQKLEVDARQAENESVLARIRLENLLGQPEAKGAFTPAESLEDLVRVSATAPLPAPAPAEGDVSNRPDVKAAAADVRRAEADVSLQRALRVPDPTVQLQYEHEPPDQPHTIGLGVSFPLPLWNRNHAGISASNAAKRQAEANAARTTAAASAEITIARRDLESALSRREDYERTIVPQSSSIRETVTFAYQKGGASLLDLLTAQRNDNEVRLNAAQAAADVIVARAALASALNEKP